MGMREKQFLRTRPRKERDVCGAEDVRIEYEFG